MDKNNAVKHKVIGFPHLSYIYFEITMAHYFTVYNFLILLKNFFLLIFRERGREGEKSMCERYTDCLPLARPQLGHWPKTQACALSGNRTDSLESVDLLVCRLALNPLSHTSQGYR